MPLYTFDPAEEAGDWDCDLLEADRDQQMVLHRVSVFLLSSQSLHQMFALKLTVDICASFNSCIRYLRYADSCNLLNDIKKTTFIMKKHYIVESQPKTINTFVEVGSDCKSKFVNKILRSVW